MSLTSIRLPIRGILLIKILKVSKEVILAAPKLMEMMVRATKNIITNM